MHAIHDGFRQNNPASLWFHRMGKRAADLLFPPRCVGCDGAGALLCAACAQQVAPICAPMCTQCGRPQAKPVQQCTLCQRQESRSLTRTRAAALFTHPLRPAIHSLKYENRPELADSLARYLVAAFCADMGFSMSASISPSISPSIDVVMPVPLHEQRQRERGYNQAELLAHAFCRRLHLPIDSHGLVRVRATVSQVGLRAYERQQNVNDAFRVRADVRGSTVLLIDDVFTTGATLTACATMLREAGAASVYALALATPPVQADAMC